MAVKHEENFAPQDLKGFSLSCHRSSIVMWLSLLEPGILAPYFVTDQASTQEVGHPGSPRDCISLSFWFKGSHLWRKTWRLRSKRQREATFHRHHRTEVVVASLLGLSESYAKPCIYTKSMFPGHYYLSRTEISQYAVATSGFCALSRYI